MAWSIAVGVGLPASSGIPRTRALPGRRRRARDRAGSLLAGPDCASSRTFRASAGVMSYKNGGLENASATCCAAGSVAPSSRPSRRQPAARNRKAGAGLGPMPSGEGLRQLVPGRLASRMLAASEGRHGRLRPDAMLGALELVVAHAVLDRCGCQGPGRSRRETFSSPSHEAVQPSGAGGAGRDMVSALLHRGSSDLTGSRVGPPAERLA